MDAPHVINIDNIDEIENDIMGEEAESRATSSPLHKIESNFGGGIELLMNEKRMSDKGNEVGNIESLEDELETLNDDAKDTEYGYGDSSTQPNGSSSSYPSINIGKQTAQVPTSARTWDGYENIEKSTSFHPDAPDGGASMSGLDGKPAPMSKEELLKEKFKYLRKLEELEKKGIKLTKSYNMDSHLSEMQGEYETIIAEKERSNSVKFQAKILMACITGVEFLNNKFDPFDIKLDGWSEQINENISDYDEVFSELHEKYRGKGKMAPELKLMFQVAGSAMMIHMTNTMFKSAVPGMDDIMKQNPELMQQFTRAAASSMGGSAPGFSNFMNMSTNMGGMDVDDAPSSSSFNSHMEDGGRAQETRRRRGDMRGPSRDGDVNDILSNMKTKINREVQSAVEETYYDNAPRTRGGGANVEVLDATDRSSNMSIKELKEISGQKMPKRGNKKKEVVTVSLDM